MQLSPNDIGAEIERVRTNNFKQFIKKVHLTNVRGFVDETIEFKYPVTALVGTNGGGKSTILGGAALSYKNIRPGQFFPKAFVGDDGMADWTVEVELVDKALSKDKMVTRTARFAQSKWRRDGFPERAIEYIEIQRTVPAGELTRFRKFLSGDKSKFSINQLSQDTIKFATAVLDKNIENYRAVTEDSNPASKMYIGSTDTAGEYSQFHFGAGEASIIETIDRIEQAAENALILIEEVENGLHPVAVRLFVQYLQNVAKRKRLQIIFTTHSQDAVDQLPSEAIWASINKRVWNGKLSIESLRAITGITPKTRVVYVEDDFVVEWVKNAIGRYGGGIAQTSHVSAAGGYPNVLNVCKYHNDNPMLNAKSIALVDGDIYKPDTDPLPDFARYLGEGLPEAIVFDFIYIHRVALVSLIRQRCLLSQFNEDRIISAIESVRNSSCDPHVIFTNLSEKLDFLSALQIRAGMIDLFNEKNPDFWTDIISAIQAVPEGYGPQP